MTGADQNGGSGAATPPWRPDSLARRRANLELRGRVLQAVRDFFAEAGFVEVDTPALQLSPGLEPHLKAFATVLHDPNDGAARPLYLHTSPEFAMKKLLAGGLPRIWQLAHVYRDGERSATHHPEFAMLEWYRAGATYRDLMDESQSLLRRAQEAAGAEELRWHGRGADARLAERFELYVCGLELANAFGELTDAVEQRRRFAADQAKKQALYGKTYPIDEDFLAALEQGLPACAGIALGFDRLVMLATGAAHIEEVLWAPVA